MPRKGRYNAKSQNSSAKLVYKDKLDCNY